MSGKVWTFNQAGFGIMLGLGTGKIGYYSKEGAAAAGNMNLAPKLILEYD